METRKGLRGGRRGGAGAGIDRLPGAERAGKLREVALREGAEGAAYGLALLARDEAFHHAYFRDVVKLYFQYDEIGTARDFVHVLNNFRMPAQHLLPNAAERVRALARNRIVSRRQIRDEVMAPIVKSVGFRDLDELVSVAEARGAHGYSADGHSTNGNHRLETVDELAEEVERTALATDLSE